MAYTPYTFGVYNASLPTLGDGEVFPVQLDVNGNLKVVVAGTVATSLTNSIPAGTNMIGHVIVDSLPVTQYADSDASGVAPFGIAASAWDVANSKIRSLTVDPAQNLNIKVAASSLTDPAEANVGAVVPSKAIQVGASDGTNLQRLLVDGSGSLKVNVITGGGGSSATGSAVPSGAVYLGVNVSGNLVGQTGLALGATTKAATVAIVDASGNQITSFGSGTVTISGTVAVTQSTSPWVVSGTVTAAQATAASLNATVVGTGTFAVQSASTLSAETTKAIGVVRNSDGAGNLLTSNSTTTAAKFGLDTNIISILGTAPTTVGKLDVKGADGDVFVRQATAGNLNATVVFGAPQHVIVDSGGGSNASIGATASAVPSSATYLGANKAGNLVGLLLDSSGNLNVNLNNSVLTDPAEGSVNATAPTQAIFHGIKVGSNMVGSTGLTVGSQNATAVAIVDASGNQITSFGSGSVTATLNAETTKIIGTVNVAASQTIQIRPQAPTTGLWSHANIAISAATGTQTLVALSGSTTIRVMKIQFTVNGATNFNFLDSAPTTLSGTYVLTGNGSSFSDFGNGEPLWVGTAAKSFQINLTGTVTVGGDIWYTQT